MRRRAVVPHGDRPDHHPDRVAVPVQYRQQPGPAAGAVTPLGPLRDARRVVRGQQLHDAVPHHVGGPVPQQALGVRGPADHRQMGVEQKWRGIRHVEVPPGRHLWFLAHGHGDPLRSPKVVLPRMCPFFTLSDPPSGRGPGTGCPATAARGPGAGASR